MHLLLQTFLVSSGLLLFSLPTAQISPYEAMVLQGQADLIALQQRQIAEGAASVKAAAAKPEVRAAEAPAATTTTVAPATTTVAPATTTTTAAAPTIPKHAFPLPSKYKDVPAQLNRTRALTERGKFSKPEDFVRDLKNSEIRSIGHGGTIQPMSVTELPALEGAGVSYTLFNLEPCGINLPHVHPRATEIIYVLQGQHLRTGFVEENDGRTIVNDIHAGMVTFFPQGLIHYQQNLGCDHVEFLSALNSEDPGTVTISTRTFTFPSEALQTTFDISPEEVAEIQKDIPQGPGQGRKDCLKICGLSTKDDV